MAKQQAADRADRDAAAMKAEVIDLIKQESRKLSEQRAANVARIIQLEQQDIIAAPPAAEKTPRQRALELLNGHAPPQALTLPKLDASAELWQLRRDNEAIDLALELLGRKQLAERAGLLAAMLPAASEEWKAHTHELVIALAVVGRLVRSRQAIREKLRIASGGGCPHLPLDAFPMTGDLYWRDQVKRFTEAAISEGLATRKEVDNA